jgi:hypothetical protein
VDLATLLAGRTIERRLQKKGATLASVLGKGPARPQRRFRSVSGLRKTALRKMRVPESGIW